MEQQQSTVNVVEILSLLYHLESYGTATSRVSVLYLVIKNISECLTGLMIIEDRLAFRHICYISTMPTSAMAFCLEFSRYQRHSFSRACAENKRVSSLNLRRVAHQQFVSTCRAVQQNIAHHILWKLPHSDCCRDVSGRGRVNHKWGREDDGCLIYIGDTKVFVCRVGWMNWAVPASLEELDVLCEWDI